jgi:hypothetical protein
MKLFLVSRNDYVYRGQYDAVVVIAESPEAAIKLLKETYAKYPQWKYLGNYDVTITEITLDEPQIVLESICIA